MKIASFKIAVLPGYGDNGGETKVCEIIHSFDYKGRKIVIHPGIGQAFGEKYTASDYTTGRSLRIPKGNNFKVIISRAKTYIDAAIEKNFDFSQYKAINP